MCVRESACVCAVYVQQALSHYLPAAVVLLDSLPAHLSAAGLKT